MKWLPAIAFLFISQDASPVPGLLARIDGKDPAACFHAIADLADLGPEHRSEVEKGAARLPEFYRDALLAELKLPSPAPKRLSIEGTRTIRKHLAELERVSSLRFDLSLWEPRRRGKDPLGQEDIPLARRDATAMEALAELCAAKSLTFTKADLSDKIELSNHGGPQVWALGQRSLLIQHKDAWHRKWIDFTSRPEWHAGLHFEVLTGPGVRVSGWKDIRVVEAVSDKGADLRLDPGAANSSILDFKEGPWESFDELDTGLWFNLRLPDDAQKVARLKFSAVARTFTRCLTVELKDLGKEGKGRGSGDGLEVEVQQVDPRSPTDVQFLVRLTSASLSGQELAARPKTIQATSAGPKRDVTFEVRRVEERSVEYLVRLEVLSEKHPDDEPDPEVLKTVRVDVADGLGERLIFAEFRDIPLR